MAICPTISAFFFSVYNDLFCFLQAIESAQAAQDIKIRFDSFQQQFQEVRCVYEVFSRPYDVDTLLNTTLTLAIFKFRGMRLSLRCVAS